MLHFFFWPSITTDVTAHCWACLACQKGNARVPPRAPLQPLSLEGTPFERVAMDFIGPLPRTAWGHRFALVLMDYVTQYPEEVLLRSMQATSVARAPMHLFSQIGLP